jgi:hypothetical protein
MVFRKEHKTPEEKKRILDETLVAIRKLVEGGVQGNISMPVYDGIVGKMKFELWCEPLEVKEMFNLGGEKNASNKLA